MAVLIPVASAFRVAMSSDRLALSEDPPPLPALAKFEAIVFLSSAAFFP
jgi:hypothetical protein